MSSNETLRKFMKTPVTIYKVTEKFSTLMENVHPYKTGIWAFAVQDENGKIIGGIDLSSSPILAAGYVKDKNYAYQTIEDIVIKDMPIFSPETSVEDAKYLMYRTRSTQRALIVENDKVVGTISIIDLPDRFQRALSPKEEHALRYGEWD